jgi:hypothetical protein
MLINEGVKQPRRGRLLNGNPSGDFLSAPRCGARTRSGTPCACPAIRGRTRCRLHGGLSTGPRTLEGIKRIRARTLKHGRYSRIGRELERAVREQQDSWREHGNSVPQAVDARDVFGDGELQAVPRCAGQPDGRHHRPSVGAAEHPMNSGVVEFHLCPEAGDWVIELRIAFPPGRLIN